MSVRYEVLRLLRRLAISLALALAIAAVAALLHGGSFRHAFEVGRYFVGAFAFVWAAAGSSPGRRYALDAESALAGSSKWNTIVGTGEAPRGGALSPAAVSIVVGVMMIALGLIIS